MSAANQPAPRATLAEALRARCRDTWHVRHGRQEDCPICRAAAALEAAADAIGQARANLSTARNRVACDDPQGAVPWLGDVETCLASAALSLGQEAKL